MFDLACPTDPAALFHLAGTLCQMATALIAATIAVETFRSNKRQNALALVNQTNTLANLVNTTVVQSPDACAALGRLSTPIVGCPDDAVLFMYLNYVHNTFRTRRIGAVSEQVWQDTLRSCAATLARLTRAQVEQLLGRGYEAAFRDAVLARHAPAGRPKLALAG